VTSPDFCHEEHAVAALAAGKHVYCEKPLAITTAGCDHILRAWQKSGKRLMVGFNMRHMNIFRCMKEIVDAGTIGEIRAVWVRHFVCYGGQWYFHDWHACRKTATSLLLQKASHDIDMIHWITGKYTRRTAAFGGLDFFGGNKPNKLECSACPERESCTEVNQWPHHEYCCFRKEVDVEDNSVMIMDLEGGIKATYTQCHFTPDYFRNYTFIGTEGRIENLDDHSRVICLTRSRSKKSKNLSNRTYDIKPAEGGHGGADPVICNDFLDMILAGKEPVSTPVAGRMSVAVGCAATESLRHGGKIVAIPPLPKGIR
jgi:predicted dehydrogenase